MRLIKTFGLAAIAAMTFMGASSAMAGDTALCKVNESPCASGNLVTSVHGIASNPELLSSLTNITCNTSLFKASVLALGNPQVAHLEELTFTGDCLSTSGWSCTFTTVLKGLFNILRTVANLGTVKSTGGTAVEWVCPTAFIDCAYGGEPTVHGLGAELPTHAGRLTASQLVLTESSHSDGFCPDNAKWDAVYEALEDVFITS